MPKKSTSDNSIPTTWCKSLEEFLGNTKDLSLDFAFQLTSTEFARTVKRLNWLELAHGKPGIKVERQTADYKADLNFLLFAMMKGADTLRDINPYSRKLITDAVNHWKRIPPDQ